MNINFTLRPAPAHVKVCPTNDVTKEMGIAGQDIRYCVIGGYAHVYVKDGNKWRGPIRRNGKIMRTLPEYLVPEVGIG